MVLASRNLLTLGANADASSGTYALTLDRAIVATMIVGKRGTGKTNTATCLVEELLDHGMQCDRLIVHRLISPQDRRRTAGASGAGCA